MTKRPKWTPPICGWCYPIKWKRFKHQGKWYWNAEVQGLPGRSYGTYFGVASRWLIVISGQTVDISHPYERSLPKACRELTKSIEDAQAVIDYMRGEK